MRVYVAPNPCFLRFGLQYDVLKFNLLSKCRASCCLSGFDAYIQNVDKLATIQVQDGLSSNVV